MFSLLAADFFSKTVVLQSHRITPFATAITFLRQGFTSPTCFAKWMLSSHVSLLSEHRFECHHLWVLTLEARLDANALDLESEGKRWDWWGSIFLKWKPSQAKSPDICFFAPNEPGEGRIHLSHGIAQGRFQLPFPLLSHMEIAPPPPSCSVPWKPLDHMATQLHLMFQAASLGALELMGDVITKCSGAGLMQSP